jgi:hypothetical protein
VDFGTQPDYVPNVSDRYRVPQLLFLLHHQIFPLRTIGWSKSLAGIYSVSIFNVSAIGKISCKHGFLAPQRPYFFPFVVEEFLCVIHDLNYSEALFPLNSTIIIVGTYLGIVAYLLLQ